MSRQSSRQISRQIARLFAWVALVVVMSGANLVMPANSARAENCRPAPSSAAPTGTHWYYRLEWATQRKCWYVRAPGRRAHQATAPAKVVPTTPAPSDPTTVADVPSPTSPSAGDITLLSSPAKTSALKAISAPASGGTIDKTPQQSAQEESAARTAEASAPQAGTSLEAGVQTAASLAAAPPDLEIAVTSAKSSARTQESAVTPTCTRADVLSDEAENGARSGGPINNAATPIIIFPVLALGLALLGIGSRFLVKHGAARGARTIIDEHQLDRVYGDGRREGRGNGDRQEFVIQGQELNSLISAVSDQGSFRADGDAVRVTREISKRRYKLAHLRQHIERTLRSAVGPSYAEPLQEQTTA